MRRLFGFVLVLALLGLLAGPAAAMVVDSVALEYSHNIGWRNYVELYQLENGSIVPAKLTGNFTSNGSYALSFDGVDDYVTVDLQNFGGWDGLTIIAIARDDREVDDELHEQYVFKLDGVVEADLRVNEQNYLGEKIYYHLNYWNNGTKQWTYGAYGVRERHRNYFTAFILDFANGGSYVWQDLEKYSLYGDVPEAGAVWDSGSGTAYIGQNLLGRIYALLIYNRALSDEEIQQIYNDPNNPPTDGLVLFYAPDSMDTKNGKWLDKSGNGNDGTIHGASYVPLAVLSAPSATFNGTTFLVNVTASLPGDGGSYLLPAPKDASSSYSSAGQIGNFTFLDVGTASSATYQLPVEPGKAVPGLRELAIETDEGIYAYGTGSWQLTTPLTAPLAKPSLITNTIQDGKVVAINWGGIDTFSKLQPSSYISSVSGSANLTILQDSDKLMKLNLDAPLKLYFQNLLPIMTYDVSNGQDKIGSFKTDTLGTASYTAPAGTIYIGTPENIQQVMSNNLTSLLTKILVIALMAGLFVEMTKTRLDDEMVALIIGLLVVLVILAILHYL